MSKFVGIAKGASGSRKALFEDPRWDERFDVLITLTTRTRLLIELLGTDVSEQRIREEMDRRLLGHRGGKVVRPRGASQSASSLSFLDTVAQRFDAAYLIGLYFGQRGLGEFRDSATNHARHVDKLIYVYSKYRADSAYRGETTQISFEVFCLLIEGVRRGTIEIHNCGVCSTAHPFPVRRQGLAHCPACSTQDIEVAWAKRVLEGRLASCRGSGSQPATAMRTETASAGT